MIKFYGASDDLVEVEGCKGADEFGVYSKNDDDPVIWRGDLIAPTGGQLRVYALYDGCWHFSIGQPDEDVPLPDWPIRFAQHLNVNGRPGHSVDLLIDAPDGTRLTNIWPSTPA